MYVSYTVATDVSLGLIVPLSLWLYEAIFDYEISEWQASVGEIIILWLLWLWFPFYINYLFTKTKKYNQNFSFTRLTVTMSSEPPSKKQKTNESEETFPGFATTVIHEGQDPNQWASKSDVPLISLSTTYKQEEPARPVRKMCPSTNDKSFCFRV